MKIVQPRNTERITLDGSEDAVLFSFKYLQNRSISKVTKSQFYYQFLFRLKKLSELGWGKIGRSDKHSFGIEPIPISQIKPKFNIPILTDDVNKLSVFRASGDNHIFAGIRSGNVFFIIFVEAQFGDFYDHN